MRVIGVGIVRNERDIIRVNVLHHLALGFDQYLIVENGSTDGTDRLLQQLSRRDGRIRWTRDPGPFRNRAVLNDLAHEAIRMGADWIVPTDADEFWYAPGRNFRQILEESTAGAIGTEVIHFIQRRTQHTTPARALQYMTRRVAEPVRPRECSRERVEASAFAWIEVEEWTKWLIRPTAALAIGYGNNGVTGVNGPLVLTDAIVRLHAPLRARAMLDEKAERGQRVNEDKERDPRLYLGWELSRLRRLQQEGALDPEWEANSYVGNTINVYGTPHPVVFDPTLRDVVMPWLRPARLREVSRNRVR